MENKKRIMSGMRPTGKLHLGHYLGVLKNWVNLQNEYDCYFSIADWHALTTKYNDTDLMKQNVQAYFIGDKKVFLVLKIRRNWDVSLLKFVWF